MPRSKQPEPRFPIKLTSAQRQAIAEFAPTLRDRLKLDQTNQRIIDFTLAELKQVKARAQTALLQAAGTKRSPLRHILQAVTQALEQSRGVASLRPSERVYQFKIT